MQQKSPPHMSKNLFSYVQGRRFQNHSTNKEILRKKDFIFLSKNEIYVFVQVKGVQNQEYIYVN